MYRISTKVSKDFEQKLEEKNYQYYFETKTGRRRNWWHKAYWKLKMKSRFRQSFQMYRSSRTDKRRCARIFLWCVATRYSPLHKFGVYRKKVMLAKYKWMRWWIILPRRTEIQGKQLKRPAKKSYQKKTAE